MIQDLISFLDKSVVNFLAADTVVRMLEADGFSHLDTRDHWDIVPGGKYYITHNGSAVFAFIAGRKPLSPFRIICAHTDSPGFRVKPLRRPHVASEHRGLRRPDSLHLV